MNAIKQIKQLIQFLTIGVWRIRARKLSTTRWFWITQLRIILLAVRRFGEDQCQLRASALTFYSLLSIVPVLAMAFGIAQGFGFEEILEKQLLDKLPGQQDAINHVIIFSRSLLKTTQGGVIAGAGVIFLFLTVVRVLENIEQSFNEIWGIKKPRGFARKLSDYLAMILICPIVWLAASSLTVLLVSKVKVILSQLSFLGLFSNLILFVLALLPSFVMWLLLTFIYIFMPNTKVNFRSAFLGGLLAGTIYQCVQLFYISFQLNISNFGAVYGSFAAIPLFLLWLLTSWLVVLFGAEVSFAEQHVNMYEFEPDSSKVSFAFKELIVLAVTQACVKKFDLVQGPLNADTIANELEMPTRLVNEIIFNLTRAGVLIEVKVGPNESLAYHPARNINDLTIQQVLNLFKHAGTDNIPVIESKEIHRIKKSLEALNKAAQHSPDNLLLKDI